MTRNSNVPSKEWMDLPRYSKDYIEGVQSFLDFAYSYGDPQGEEIQCPCAKCCNIRWTRRNVVYDHLICYEFVQGYTRWINHGEKEISMNVNCDMDDNVYSYDDIDGLLNDQFRNVAHAGGVYEGPNEDAKKFYNLVDEASQELYPGCKGFSRLSFTIRLYLLKCLHGWSNASFTSLLELLKEAMPNLNIPISYNKAKSMVKDLGLDYEKIDACPNDCMLFRNDHKDDEYFHTAKLPDGSASNISREYEVEVSNQRRGSKWSKAKKHSQNFSQWFENRSLKEDVPDLIKQLSFGPNSIAKRYSRYFINGYRFHVRQRDARRKTQNSGVTLVAQTTSFASSKDKNPVDANLTYYGRIVDIVELDYYDHFRVVLFKCDWYEVEEDIYGLTYVYFNKKCKCYQNEPFVLVSQVHQCFYVQYPYDQDRYYVMKTVRRDLFSISDELESNAPQCYENEPSEYLAGPSIPEDNGEVALVRSDAPATILDVVHIEDIGLTNFEEPRDIDRMNQAAALKRKVPNPNKAQSPMKNIGFDFQYRSSAELAKKFQIKREKLASDRNDEAAKEHALLGVKRKNCMPATLEGQSRQRLTQSDVSVQKLGRNRLPVYKSIQSSSREDLNTSHNIASKGQIKQRSIQLEEPIQKQGMSKLPVPTSMIQSSAKVDPNTLHMLRRTQGEGEKQLDIQELQNCKKENEVRFMSSPIIDEREIELDNFASQDEVGDDEFIGDEDMNIDGAAGTSEKKRVRGKITCKNIHARSFEEREESKFLIPAEGEKWVMTGLRDAWKRHNMNIKKKYFDKNATIEQMLQNRPDEIPEVQFRQLIEYWDDEHVQKTGKSKVEASNGPINFARVRVALRATKENNEEPSKSEMFITTRTKKGKEVHTDTQVAISELHNRQSSRETADDAFRAVFEKEQPGRVRCYGRSVMTSSPKKDEEITKLKQKHADEITSLKEEMKEMMREKMRCFFSQMVKNNPGLDFHDIQGCVGSNIHSPVDASSARAMRGQNLPNSSGSTHASNLEKENTDDAIGYGCHKSI
ncbi:hypothetical protein A4A49_31278 [Nicotiana attenuata]|uniref:Transposase-associated domain-containing protein n=1 Tax=Nicotiana attenuata TaxID=49451 RepID=A0A314KHV8_NICAT|nr:hypothetical protein A4A49_31278 [Nicotiana attenuata]